MAFLSLNSELCPRNRATSAAIKSVFEPKTSMPDSSTCTMALLISHSSRSSSHIEFSSVCLSTPQPIVALPCGSISISKTRFLIARKAALKLTAVVVLPTPPF